MNCKNITSGFLHGVKHAKRKMGVLFPHYGLHAQSQVYVELTTHCNMKCSYCAIWEKDHNSEPNREQWFQALSDLLDSLGNPKINFAGGEPMVSPFLFDLLQYCVDRGAYPGFVTNGVLLTDQNIERLSQINITNINISLDDDRPEVFDQIRNRPGHTRQILTQIVKLKKAFEEKRCSTKIFLKSVIHAGNFDRLTALTLLTQKLKCDGIIFQPLCATFGKEMPSDWYRHDPLWPTEKQMQQLEKEINQLYIMRQQNAPIANSAADILRWHKYFRTPDHFSLHSNDSPCMIGYNNIYLFANGEIKFCPDRKAVGDFTQESLRQVLYAAKTEQEIIHMRKCKGSSCVKTCMTPKSFSEMAKRFFELIRN